MAFYAKALNMHPNHLNALVKKYTGLTAKETINDYILTEAQSLLHYSNLRSKRSPISWVYGPGSILYLFSQAGKRQPPSAFRLNPG